MLFCIATTLKKLNDKNLVIQQFNTVEEATLDFRASAVMSKEQLPQRDLFTLFLLISLGLLSTRVSMIRWQNAILMSLVRSACMLGKFVPASVYLLGAKGAESSCVGLVGCNLSPINLGVSPLPSA